MAALLSDKILGAQIDYGVSDFSGVSLFGRRAGKSVVGQITRDYLESNDYYLSELKRIQSEMRILRKTSSKPEETSMSMKEIPDILRKEKTNKYRDTDLKEFEIEKI